MTTLTKITLCYIGGILLGYYLSIPPLYLWTAIGLFFLAGLIFFSLKQNLPTALALLILFTLIGLLFYELAITPSRSIPHFRSRHPVEITGTIIRDPDIRQNKTIFVLKPEEVISREQIPPLKGQLRVTIRWPKTTFHYGERIRFSSRLWTPQGPKDEGSFDYRAYLFRQKIYSLMRIDGDDQIVRLGRGRVNPIMGLAIKIKEKMVNIIKLTLPHPSNLVLEGMMLGKRTNLPRKIEWWLEQVGVGHILTASGLHVGFVLFIFLGLFHQALRIPLKGSMLLTIFFVILYTLIAGARPATIRASIMAISIITFYLLDRESSIYHGLALAALIILIINPLTLFDCGFQLSFSATLGIIALSPPIGKYLKRFLRDWLAMPLAISISAQLSIWPLLAYYFNQLSLIAIVANLLIVPLVACGVGFGFASFGLGLMSLELARTVGIVNHLVLTGLINSAHALSLIPYASIYIPRFPTYFIFGYYLILILFSMLVNRKSTG